MTHQMSPASLLEAEWKASGVDRRAHKRYRCNGCATIAIVPSLPAAEARLHDISLSGCALRLLALDEFEPEMRVELRICSPYLAFRALGHICFARSTSRMVRLRYIDLNLRGQADILNFIADEESRWRSLVEADLDCRDRLKASLRE